MKQTNITFEGLSATQQDHLRDVHTIIDRLIIFGNNANLKLFTYLFGEEQAYRHALNMNRCRSKGGILIYYKQLTADEKSVLLANLYYNDALYSHC